MKGCSATTEKITRADFVIKIIPVTKMFIKLHKGLMPEEKFYDYI